MEVLLVNPPYDIERYMGKLSKAGFVFPPVGLTYIAAYLREKGVDVSIFDYQVHEGDVERVVEEHGPGIIGVTCQTSLVYSTIELSRRLKRRFPDKTIVVGGVHASIRPEDLLAEPGIDYVVRGEGERTMHELVVALREGRDPVEVDGICAMRGGAVVCARQREMVDDLDVFPMPAIDLLPVSKYKTSPDNISGGRVGVLLTSRGCPFSCMFCSSKLLTHGRYRMHGIERVCREVERYIDEYGVDQLFIVDDNFAVNKKRTIELCNEFVKRGFNKKVTWWADARVDCVNEEVLTAMKNAGCTIISYGLESGVQRLLDSVVKGITLEQIRRTVALTKKVGIDVRATFILGLPTETREESLQTIRFAKELAIDQVRFSLATPFPGTKLYDIAKEEGGITSDDWTNFSMMSGYASGKAIYAPKGRDPEELARLQRRATLSFFFRPRVFGVYLKRMVRSPAVIKDISSGFLRLLVATFSKSRR